jgi:hypothetical protein
MKGNLKKAIVVVILAALTLAAFSMLLGPSVRADTSEAQVLSYNWYVAPSSTDLAEYSGDLVAVGEVQNVGSNVLGQVVVEGYAYNSTGGLLAANEAPVFLNDLLPGQKAPFYIDFPPEDSITQDQSWVPYVSNVTVIVTYVTDANATQYSGLTSTGTSASNVDGTYTVTGTVQNTGDETTGNVWVVTTFYGASGSVVGLNYTNYLSSSLAPGESVPFTATPTDNTAQLSSEIANYSLLTQSSPTGSPSGSPSPLPSSSSSASPTSSPTGSPVSVQSSGSSGLIYGVIGVVVIVVVAVLALVFLRKRRNLPPPPPSG